MEMRTIINIWRRLVGKMRFETDDDMEECSNCDSKNLRLQVLYVGRDVKMDVGSLTLYGEPCVS